MDIYGIIAFICLVTISLGVLAAAYELRQTRLQRRREAQIDLLRPFTEPSFQAALQDVLTLPDGLDRAAVEDRLGPDLESLHRWLGTVEVWGLVVHRRDLPLSLVGDLAGQAIAISWQKLGAYVADVRLTTADPSLYAWYQWLAERWIDRDVRRAPTQAPSTADWNS